MSNLNLKVIIGETDLAEGVYNKIKPWFDGNGLREVKKVCDADFRLVLGGDGTILKEVQNDIKKSISEIVPVFGIKAGNPRSKGMLLNDIIDSVKSKEELIEMIKSSVITAFPFLEGEVKNLENFKKVYGFNDFSIIRKKAQSTATNIYIDGKLVMERALGDGFIISTPQGSTAYNKNAGGSIATAMEILQITGSNSNFKNLVLSNLHEIKLTVLEKEKRPQILEVDGKLIGIFDEIKFKISNKITKIAFKKDFTYFDKIIQEAIRQS